MSVNVSITITIGPEEISNRTNEKLLGVTFDREFEFEIYANGFCETVSNKMHALAGIAPFMSLSKTKSIMHLFAQFNYCLQAWVLPNRKLSNII